MLVPTHCVKSMSCVYVFYSPSARENKNKNNHNNTYFSSKGYSMFIQTENTLDIFKTEL